MTWESAERVQKNDAGEFRAFINGQWVPVARAQKSEAGQFRVDRTAVQRPPAETPAFEKEAADLLGTSGAELALGSAPGRFALGAASPIIGAAQVGANALGMGGAVNEWAQRLEAMKQKGMRAQPNEVVNAVLPDAMKDADVAGFSGTVASPVFLKAGAALPVASTIPAKIAQGAAVGAAAGATTPVTEKANLDEYWTTKGGQTVLGLAFGAAIPAGVELAKGAAGAVKRTVEPLTEAGRAAILRRYQDELIGANRPQVIQALENSIELTTGSKPTVAEAVAAIPGASPLAAHQKVISKAPETSGAFVARRTEQETARQAAVGGVAQDEKALKLAIDARKTATDPLYKAAREGGDIVDARLALGKIDSILSKNPGNRELVAELNNIRSGLMDGKTLRTDTQEVASVIDGIKAAVADEKNKFIKGILTSIKGDLEKSIPGYLQAQRTFAQASPPINQMQVGQYLQDKLTGAVGPERAPAFAQAVRDAPGTIKRATGAPRFDNLNDVLTPRQDKAVMGTLADLQRRLRSEKLAAGTNLTGGGGIVEGQRGVHLPNLLSRPAMIANFVLKRIGEGADQKINRLAGEQYLDPQKLADALKKLPAPLRQTALTELVRMGRVPAIAAAVQEGVQQ